MTEEEIERRVSKIGHDAYHKTSFAVKETLIRVNRETESKNGADITRAMMYGALGGLVPLAMVIAKRLDIANPPKTPDDCNESHAEACYALVRPETLTFAALACANMPERVTYEVTSVAFGPTLLRDTLEQWKKLFPQHKPEDWLDNSILDCVNKIEEQSNVPLEEFLAKKGKSQPGPTTLQ